MKRGVTKVIDLTQDSKRPRLQPKAQNRSSGPFSHDLTGSLLGKIPIDLRPALDIYSVALRNQINRMFTKSMKF